MDKMRVHSCARGAKVVDRDCTAQEQERNDAARSLGVVDMVMMRAHAVKALDDARLAAAIADPNAPQVVKDYAAALAAAPTTARA